MYIFWGMGSGKTIAGCICMQRLTDAEPRVLVLCDKSTVEQWTHEVTRMLHAYTAKYAKLRVRIEHYESLDKPDGPDPSKMHMVVCDEAHRFRNAWEKPSTRMIHWMSKILRAPYVVYLSGTPIVHDAHVELDALREMMGTDDTWKGRFSYYDPRTDDKQSKHFATVEDEVVRCPMSWSQALLYMQSRKQTFTIQLDGEPQARTRVSSSRNTYNTQVRSISNCPFPKDVSASPKLVRMCEKMLEAEELELKQVVYSSRKDTGVFALVKLWSTHTRRPRAIFKIDGSMSKEDRGEQITRFNRWLKGAVVFITDAAAQGVDFKRVHAVHVMEPADNLQEERQVINRAVRYKAHKEKDAVVRLYRYVSVFPVTASVAPPWKTLLFETGLFARDEMHGLTRRVQYALLRLMRDEENGHTIDEKTLLVREERDARVQGALDRLKACCPDHAQPTDNAADTALGDDARNGDPPVDEDRASLG